MNNNNNKNNNNNNNTQSSSSSGSGSGAGKAVVNDFLKDGRQITWFGGSRMYDDSPIIESLIKIGKNAQRRAAAAAPPPAEASEAEATTKKTEEELSTLSSSSSTPSSTTTTTTTRNQQKEASTHQLVSAASSSEGAIILWCRRYDQVTKAFSPYCCFGRLGYSSHVVGSYPLSFVWNLLDYDQLLYRGGQTVRDMMML